MVAHVAHVAPLGRVAPVLDLAKTDAAASAPRARPRDDESASIAAALGAPLARVCSIGRLTAGERDVVDALVLRLYGAAVTPLDAAGDDAAAADVLVVGRRPLEVDGELLARARPRRVLLVLPHRRDDLHLAEARRWHDALPDAHVLLLELDAVRRLGLDEAARLARVSLAACWAVSPSAGPLPLLPRAPREDADA